MSGQAITLPIAFSTKKYSTVCVHDGSQTDVNVLVNSAYRNSLTQTEFLISISTQSDVTWICIGK